MAQQACINASYLVGTRYQGGEKVRQGAVFPAAPTLHSTQELDDLCIHVPLAFTVYIELKAGFRALDKDVCAPDSLFQAAVSPSHERILARNEV